VNATCSDTDDDEIAMKGWCNGDDAIANMSFGVYWGCFLIGGGNMMRQRNKSTFVSTKDMSHMLVDPRYPTKVKPTHTHSVFLWLLPILLL
jgi:hypothetical protein